ncbi:TPA: hypothetical protein H1016_03185 [archaeon]|uniref:Uncharacterized protein n=1 Tax=Candidatus Naiadarchaeum limnaeum TaxID=2756139 RepID=A0A832XJF4_9ARCH|nr:hypothetical protein [Candidatus Naiadarchaeum limnaeum]
MGNFQKGIREVAQENRPPGGAGSLKPLIWFLGREGRISLPEAKVEAISPLDVFSGDVAAIRYWKDSGAKAEIALSRLASIAIGKELVGLMLTKQYSSLNSLSAMLHRLNEINDVDKAKRDKIFRTAFNLLLGYEIAKNEIEENYFATLYMRGFFLGLRESFLAKQYAQIVGNPALEKSGDPDDLKDYLTKLFGRKVVIGKLGNVSAAKEFLEALAVAELAGSEAEAGQLAAPAHLWKDRGRDAIPRLQSFLRNGEDKYVDRGSGIPIITGEGLRYLLRNLLFREGDEKFRFGTVDALGMQFIKIDELNDVKKALTDPVFLNSLRIYLGLKALSHEVLSLIAAALGEFDTGLQFSTWRLRVKYGNYLDMSKFVKETHNRGGVFTAGHMEYFAKNKTV